MRLTPSAGELNLLPLRQTQADAYSAPFDGAQGAGAESRDSTLAADPPRAQPGICVAVIQVYRARESAAKSGRAALDGATRNTLGGVSSVGIHAAGCLPGEGNIK